MIVFTKNQLTAGSIIKFRNFEERGSAERDILYRSFYFLDSTERGPKKKKKKKKARWSALNANSVGSRAPNRAHVLSPRAA